LNFIEFRKNGIASHPRMQQDKGKPIAVN